MPSHHFVVGTWNWQAWLIFLLHYWSSSWRSNPVTVTIEPRLSGSSNSALGPRCERLLIHFVSNLCRGTKNNWWMTTYQSDLLWLPHDLNPSMPVSFMFGALVHGRARILISSDVAVRLTHGASGKSWHAQARTGWCNSSKTCKFANQVLSQLCLNTRRAISWIQSQLTETRNNSNSEVYKYTKKMQRKTGW